MSTVDLRVTVGEGVGFGTPTGQAHPETVAAAAGTRGRIGSERSWSNVAATVWREEVDEPI